MFPQSVTRWLYPWLLPGGDHFSIQWWVFLLWWSQLLPLSSPSFLSWRMWGLGIPPWTHSFNTAPPLCSLFKFFIDQMKGKLYCVDDTIKGPFRTSASCQGTSQALCWCQWHWEHCSSKCVLGPAASALPGLSWVMQTLRPAPDRWMRICLLTRCSRIPTPF